MDTPEELAARHTTKELDEQLGVIVTRVQDIEQRCYTQQRDISTREQGIIESSLRQAKTLKRAVELREQTEAAEAEERRAQREHRERSALIGEAMEMYQRGNQLSPLAISTDNLGMLEQARREYRSLSVIEQRAAVKTTDMGTATEYGPNGLVAPRTLWRASGMPTTQPPAGYSAVVPKFTLPSGIALKTEGTAHAEFDDVAPDSVTLGRTGAWSDLTAEANISTTLAELSAAHARIIARDLDLATVGKIEDTPSGVDIDTALLTVAAEAAADVSQLWVFGTPADVAALAGNATFTAANASDVGSYATMYGGARLYPTPAATAGTLTVFFPGAFRAFATPLASGVVVDPTTGAQRFGQWMLFGLGQSLDGAAITIDNGGSV